MNACPNCGCRVYALGCVNCDEENYIEQQKMFTDREPEYDAPEPMLNWGPSFGRAENTHD